MANKQTNFTVTMLLCPVIEAAAAGSVDAINVVLKHYERYITALSTRTLYEDIKTVQDNLGHATAAFTLDVYGHATAEMKRSSANRMEAFIGGLATV